jgi:LmbE family N-acetylglucosaminyl deacetylase
MIIVAHPDDEVLWFSSILEEVGQIIFCFLSVDQRPDLTEGRLKSYNEFPIANILNLKLDESKVFNLKHIDRPEETAYGIKVGHIGSAKNHYISNFSILVDKLRPLLSNADHVFTHNPWGEYGNEEHIQVYRAVKSLQRQSAFEIWFPNYFSNRSASLMSKSISKLPIESVIKQTNTRLAKQLSELYKKNGCWTWYDDWAWPEQEAFIKDADIKSADQKAQTKKSILPFHLIQLRPPPQQHARRGIVNKIKNRIKRTIASNSNARIEKPAK